MDINLLKYPKKSHRKNIQTPHASAQLAELMGIVLGDGGINNTWQLVITLNSVSDLAYSFYVKELLEHLFLIKVVTRKRPGMNAMVLVCSSTELVDFLVSKGAARGNKIKQQIDVPAWIMTNQQFKRNFVRGLVDTDGCLYIHRHTINGILYQNIGLCFSSASKNLLYSVAKIMDENGIKPHISRNNQKIYLYSAQAVLSYLGVFGSSNPRILQKYQEWERCVSG
jgi:hypothetical protein